MHWSGSINSPDGGVDVRVDAGIPEAISDFIKRANTIFQVKTHKMPAGAIANEMRPEGKLQPAIAQQVRIDGAYIIVSLSDDCSEKMKMSRLDAMQLALGGVPNADRIHLDFYDRSRLLQWLRQHPSVAIWVREILGQPLSGWRPFGRWTNPPAGDNDSLILETGVSIIPTTDRRYKKLGIESGIASMRNLVLSTRKAVRIVGLSGIGKTRIAQALFDETVGEQPLDRTSAIYVDMGADPVPSAIAMLERLHAENRTAFLVVDNCPSDLHGKLASRVSSVNSNVHLITVEYDIRDDTPQTTKVVRIEADGPQIAKMLLLRRYQGIGSGNAHRIAEFACGNARVALAVAERVQEGESLAHLSDADLFDRLFFQRKAQDVRLRQHARLMALVYSFSVKSPEAGADELAVLGSIQNIPRDQLFGSAAELLDRQVAQQRSHWRAILPHAVANRLAAEALNHIPPETLRYTFEASGRERLLTSFAHRLGLMHDHPSAQCIARSWLSEGGLLSSISNLDVTRLKMLYFVAPVAPDAVLDRIEAEINSADFAGMQSTLSLLTSLAYERDAFCRCVSLLLRMADFEDESNNQNSARGTIVSFFQAYMSGTHASLDQRAAVLRDALNSSDDRRRSLGLKMLAAALGDGLHWCAYRMNHFGARPRDFGFEPNRGELVEWYCRFIDIAVEYGLREDGELARQARQALAEAFRGLWRLPGTREMLFAAALKLNSQRALTEFWKPVRKTIFFDCTGMNPGQNGENIPPELKQLSELLEPSNLMARIDIYVFGHDNGHWFLDEEFNNDEPSKYEESTIRLEQMAWKLGMEFASSGKSIATLGTQLFSNGHMPYRRAFGRGLEAGALDKQAMWDRIVGALDQTETDNSNFSFLKGFIEQLDCENRSHAQRILDQSLENPRLSRELVYLHPVKTFDEGDLDRCIRALEVPDVKVQMYGDLLWMPPYAHLPAEKLRDLATRVLARPAGEEVILDALAMKLHGKNPDDDVLGSEFRRLGLIAAKNRLLNTLENPDDSADHYMNPVLRASFRFGGNQREITAWFDALFDAVDRRHGYLVAFNDSAHLSAKLMPCEFLDRVFIDDDEKRQKRFWFVECGAFRTPVLSGINVDTLITWCKARNDPDAWRVVASGLQIWISDGEDKTVRLGDAAIRFLEASPVPEDILKTIASKVSPRLWSGSRADIMERRTVSLMNLFRHADARISSYAREIVEEAMKWISNVRQREHREDELQEQRFE